MKSKKILAILLSTILTFGLISCKNTDNNSSSGDTTTPNQSTSQNQSDNSKITDTNDLIKLIGKSADDIKKIFGDGEENIYEKDLLGIYYANEDILGEKANLDIGFDDDTNKVSTVSVSFKNETEETYTKVYEKLTNDLGTPTSKENDAEDIEYKETWEKGGSTINIIKMGNSTNINIE